MVNFIVENVKAIIATLATGLACWYGHTIVVSFSWYGVVVISLLVGFLTWAIENKKTY